MHKDNYDLLDHHQKASPCKEASDRIGEPFQQAHSAPHYRISPKANGRQDQKSGENNEEEFDRRTIVNEPHH